MSHINVAQPDVTLLLDMGGVIREAKVSSQLTGESVNGWLGCSWDETVAEFVSDKVRRMVADTRESGVSAFRQVTQRFPSGREVPIEYTTVLLGGRTGMMAIGKSLMAVAELQSRFVAAQQTVERDYWKLREVETRYRLLFNHSSDAVVLVRAGDCTIEEANPAAIRALGLDLPPNGARKNLLAAIQKREQAPLRAMLQRAQDGGKAPGALVHLGPQGEAWMVRASAVRGDPGPMLLLQLVSANPRDASAMGHEIPAADATIECLADGFVLIDAGGIVRVANQAFADMVDMTSAASVLGHGLERWIWRPGADVPALIATLRDHGIARLFPSALRSELGSESDVEISAATVTKGQARFFGLVIRDIGRRLTRLRDPKQMNALIESVAEPVGRLPLKQLIRSTVDGVERHYIKAALDLVGGNRTAAAEVLGLSRQSLYMKLGRYGLDDEVLSGQEQEE